jgi:hypothetical protein
MATRKPRRPRPRKAVIDRVEDGKWAVLLVGRDELEKIIHVDQLPQGARAGLWLKVRLEEDRVSDIEMDEAETRAAQARVSSKLEMLRQRGAHFKPVAASDVQDGSNKLQNPLPDPDSTARYEEPEAAKGAAKLLSGPVDDTTTQTSTADGTLSPSSAPASTPPDTPDETGA